MRTVPDIGDANLTSLKSIYSERLLVSDCGVTNSARVKDTLSLVVEKWGQVDKSGKLGKIAEVGVGTPVVFRLLPVLVSRERSLDLRPWEGFLEKLVSDLPSDVIFLSRISICRVEDIEEFENLAGEADAVLIYKVGLGLGDALRKIAEAGKPLLLLAGTKLDKPSFMGNTFIDLENNVILLSHCVAPRKMAGYKGIPLPYVLRSQHWGKQPGSLSAFVELTPGQEVTVCRLAGDLRSMLLANGEIQACEDLAGFCRITAKVKLNGSVRELIRRTSGNHHVLVYGDHRDELQALNELLGIETIKI